MWFLLGVLVVLGLVGYLAYKVFGPKAIVTAVATEVQTEVTKAETAANNTPTQQK